MRRQQTLISVLGLVLITTFAADATGQRRKRSSWRDRTALKHVLFKSNQPLKSEHVDAAVYSIYLPKSYTEKASAKKRYPVVYFLHGMFEDHNRFNTRGGAKVLDDALGKKLLPEVIFVCAYDGNRRSFYVNKGEHEVEDMIVNELVPHVDKKYRTIAERGQRAILGVSMGGFGAMKIAFKHTDVFGILATHSAAILPEKSDDIEKMFPQFHSQRLATTIFGNPVDQKRWKANNPLILAKDLAMDKLKSLRIYFDCGDEDRYDLHTTNLLMHKLLDSRKMPHTWKLVKGGNHGWNTRRTDVGYNIANLPNSLRFVGQAFSQKKAMKGLSGLLGGGKDKDGGK